MSIIQTGAKGSAVIILQQALAILGYNIPSADGDFDNQTNAAVVQFQTDKGLSPDGVVGPNTWGALQSAVGPMGIDISHFNSIDLNNLPPLVQFVYCKGTDGPTFKDGKFQSYISTLKANGTIYGAYHFFRFQEPVQDQVDNYLGLGIDFSAPGTLPPALDIEDQVSASANALVMNNKAICIAAMADWLQAVAAQTGRTPIIYTYRSFWHEYLGNPSGFENYPLWLASYQVKAPGIPPGWNDHTIWQYFGASESVPGMSDLDIFNGTLDELKAFAQMAIV